MARHVFACTLLWLVTGALALRLPVRMLFGTRPMSIRSPPLQVSFASPDLICLATRYVQWPEQSPMAAAVQKLALSDATRCLDECLLAPSCCQNGDVVGMIGERYNKALHWTETRAPIAHWALRRWLETQLQLPEATPFQQSSITLVDALAPLKTRNIYRKALLVKPITSMKIGWRLVWMLISRKWQPQEQRRRQLEPLMKDIAIAYDELVQRELTSNAWSSAQERSSS